MVHQGQRRITRKLKLAATFGIFGLISACIGMDPSRVVYMKPQGDAFTQALHAEYAELAVKESTLYDWTDATRFARKAEAAAFGRPVLPEMPEIWGIPPARLPEIRNAREILLAALEDEDARVRVPKQAAAAQAALDCWIEEQEEGHQPEMIAECRRRWEVAMADVQSAVQPEIQPAAGPAAPAILTQPLPAQRYEIHFGSGSTQIDERGRRAIKELVETAQRIDLGRIIVAGHTDRVGPPALNEIISQQRAQAVAVSLISAGLPADLIQTEAYGEEFTAVETADGVPHPLNRRVVVRLL